MEYKKLAGLYGSLEKTPSRLKKIEMIAGFLKSSDRESVPEVIMLLQGTVFPTYSGKEVGVAEKTMTKALAAALGFSDGDVLSEFNRLGDLGLAAESLIKKKKQKTLFRERLTVSGVFRNIKMLAETEGKGSQELKMKLISQLLSHAEPEEAKYIARTVLGIMRVGSAEGVLRDAIAAAWFPEIIWTDKSLKSERMAEIIKGSEGKKIIIEKGLLERLSGKGTITDDERRDFLRKNSVREEAPEKISESNISRKSADCIFLSDEGLASSIKKTILNGIEWAWFLTSDYSTVAVTAMESGLNGLRGVRFELGVPIQPLLAEKSPSLEEALEAFEKPAVETKYDGMRVQVHKKGDRVWLFTRRLENVTNAFPDLVRLVRENTRADECIMEGEVLGISSDGRPLPFQQLSQRIKRKYDIQEMQKQVPVQINLFDMLMVDGKSLFTLPLRERRSLLEKSIKQITGKFQLARQLVTRNLREAEKFYQESLNANQEGVMVKNLEAPYQPGRRVAGGWLKVKPVMENLDLVITGAQWGTGKRAGWFGSFILSCMADDGFMECGMMGTGIKEKKGDDGDITFVELTKMLKPLVVGESGSTVTIKPNVVLEVAYEEIQRSPTYSSGFALRFPRLVRLRTDKGPEDADTIDRIKRLFSQQKGKRNI